MIYDLVIIGGGPGGVAAGIYAARKKIRTILITDTFGGQSLVSDDIQNWVGVKSISGFDLAKNLEEHLRAQSGVEILDGDLVQEIYPVRNSPPQDPSGASIKIGAGEISNGVNTFENGKEIEIIRIGEKILIAKGGIGGKGNFHFRSSTNTTPKQFQTGLPGENFTLRLELKLIADVGLIGLPNAGKSSLLNELTKAKARVANYPFTTLEPNLGTYYELILADIPGLIEGASDGKGLGVKFLRHIERTKILFHLISAESENPMKDYKTIKSELSKYNKKLGKKIEYIFLSKSDLVSPPEINPVRSNPAKRDADAFAHRTSNGIKKKISALKKSRKNALPISVYDWESLEKVKEILNKIIKEKNKK